jgi:hypothetical protein
MVIPIVKKAIFWAIKSSKGKADGKVITALLQAKKTA